MLGTIAGLMAVSAAQAASTDLGQPPAARAEIVYQTVFLTDQKWEDAPISRPISDRVLKLIPQVEGKFQMIALTCNRIKANGRLDGCRIETDPKTDDLQAVAKAAAKDVRIDKAYARSVQNKVRWISIMMRISRSSKPAISGPCWPPMCIPVPPPPVPRAH